MRAPAEFWVMMIVCHESDLPKRPELAAQLAAGDIQVVNHELVVPVEVFQEIDEERAQSRAMEFAVKRHQVTGCRHKVVMSADV